MVIDLLQKNAGKKYSMKSATIPKTKNRTLELE